MHLILVMPLLVIKPSMVFDENLLILSKTLNNYVQFLAVLYIFLILCPIFVDKYTFDKKRRGVHLHPLGGDFAPPKEVIKGYVTTNS